MKEHATKAKKGSSKKHTQNKKPVLYSILITCTLLFSMFMCVIGIPMIHWRKIFLWICLPFSVVALIFCCTCYRFLNPKRKILNWVWSACASLLPASFCYTFITGFQYSFVEDILFPFWIPSLIAGVISSGLLTAWLIRKKQHRWFSYLGYFVLFFAIVFIVFHMGLFANLNYMLDQDSPVEYTAIIEEKDINRHRRGPEDYYFEVTADGQSFDLNVGEWTYKKYKVGDEYSFQKYGGAFGVPFYVAE